MTFLCKYEMNVWKQFYVLINYFIIPLTPMSQKQNKRETFGSEQGKELKRKIVKGDKVEMEKLLFIWI